MHEKTKTTTLIEIRDFLAAEGCAPPPWAAPERAVDALYRLLRERRGDDRFWAELAALVRRLDDARFDPSPLAEVLGDSTVDRLVGDLRRSLEGPTSGARSTALAWVASAAGASALAAFLLLGAATGCDSGDADADADADADVEPDAEADADADAEVDANADADATCEEAEGFGFTGEWAATYCGLLDLVRDSGLDSGARSSLYLCLPDADAARRADLIERFSTMSGEDLVGYLESLTQDPDDPCYDDEGAH